MTPQTAHSPRKSRDGVPEPPPVLPLLIPRIFHRVWLGGGPIPAEHEDWWSRWQALHPGWEARTWTEADEDDLYARGVLPSEHRSLLPSFSSRSDLMRNAILREVGGVYLDTDFEPVRNIEPLLPGVSCFAGFDSDHGREGRAELGSAIYGSVPGHPAFAAVYAMQRDYLARQASRGEAAQDIPLATRPQNHLLQYLCRTQWGTVTLFPRETFYPYGWREAASCPPAASFGPGTYAVHRWRMSWCDLPRLSVIVPYGGDVLRMEWVLAGLAGQSDAEFEVIVINDGKDEGPIRELIGRFPALAVRYLLLPPDPDNPYEVRNDYRPGAARNLGIRAARGAVCLFVDQDAVPAHELVREHRRAYHNTQTHQTDQGAGLSVFGYSVFGYSVFGYGKRLRIPEADVRAYAGDLSPVWAAPLVWGDQREIRGSWGATAGQDEAGEWWTNNASAPTEALRRIGGFDEAFRGWGGDDVDVACRLWRSGLRPRRIERAEIYHLEHPRLPLAEDELPRAWRALREPDWPVVANGGPLVPFDGTCVLLVQPA